MGENNSHLLTSMLESLHFQIQKENKNCKLCPREYRCRPISLWDKKGAMRNTPLFDGLEMCLSGQGCNVGIKESIGWFNSSCTSGLSKGDKGRAQMYH